MESNLHSFDVFTVNTLVSYPRYFRMKYNGKCVIDDNQVKPGLTVDVGYRKLGSHVSCR